MHTENIIKAGKPVEQASKAMIMIHGRGASAEDILSLANYFPVSDFALLAPQATNNTWYPQSFLAPPAQNEPWLSSALDLLKKMVDDLQKQGITKENIYFLGFSQGACLTLEFITRNAARYGGAVAFTGGLIGDKIYPEKYAGSFEGTPVFIGSSNPDFHVPVERVYASTNILRNMGADVTEQIYDNMGHTINADEIRLVNELIFGNAIFDA
ncbi:phospholipase [Pseudoflavitalea sp. G-6-1-2]|uniref:alpha/beta hydrolase n=1 Tax=Pseudoflavitalea sp. G-6-1-2 TaxID=2728841 RepID=UPI00146DCE16|nr:dienelactone hydrolase family protein [Pseudoflavitalea sp. G-6-1-2]NML22603.1 phospholipase [Pseudoflavitalea sp. G-6-1-2]